MPLDRRPDSASGTPEARPRSSNPGSELLTADQPGRPARLGIDRGSDANTLVAEQWVPCAVADVFPFFSRASNLERLTPGFLHLRIRSTSAPEIGQGFVIRYDLRLHGLPLRWASRIDLWSPPHAFTDTQLSGPFRLWRHLHEFVDVDGGTLLRDTVHYAMPFHRFAAIPPLSWVDDDVRVIFRYRQQVIADLFGGATSGERRVPTSAAELRGV